MDNRITIILELLSAGVIASLVAGIFSLVIAFSRLYELILNWHKYDSAQRGDTAEEIAFYRLLNLFMDDSGRYEIAKPLLDKCYIEELEVKKTEGEKLLNDLVGAELPDGTHSEEFPAIKQRYFDIAKEFSKMLKTVINCQLEELLCKSN